MFQPRSTISEGELDPELDIARSPVTTQFPKVSICLGKCSVEFPAGIALGSEAQARIESVEIRMIEKIEHFGPELEAILLLKFPILGYREINVSKPRLPHESTFQVTKLPERRRLEGGRI